MFFASDNAGPVPQQVLDQMVSANSGYLPSYGADPQMEQVTRLVREKFKAPDAAVYLVGTGTAANALALSTLSQPWETVFCSPVSHIHEDECNAPEFYLGGGKLTLVGDSDKITPEALFKSIEGEENRGVHGPQRGPVSITQITEKGHSYSVEEVQAISNVAKTYGLALHMDGARFTNAIVARNASPAEMTWRAGVDALSFGGTKNGLMGVEGVIFFDPKHAWEFELRRKRGAHLFSKHRYLSAQMLAYLTDDLWLDLARRANGNFARLKAGLETIPDVQLRGNPDGNMTFFDMPRALHKRAEAAGAVYYWDDVEGPMDQMIMGRLVCDWSITHDMIDQFIACLQSD
ncbi:MAG: low specificity L-threonine aldolase [Rhodobacteraceae bacterium]|jgi:threonine aldolase|nr:low specificity L-threonine aldolase [Paracoccaceae bacterium]